MTLKIEVRDIKGFPVTGVKAPLLELQAGSVDPVAAIKAGEYQRHCSLEVSLPWLVRYRLAILFYGAVAGMFISILAPSLLNAFCIKMHTNIDFIAALKPFSAFYMGVFYSMKMMQQP